MAASSSGDFFRLVPRRSYLIFMAGVFCVFAPLGLLSGSSFVEQRPWGTVLLAYFISGGDPKHPAFQP